MPAASSKQRLVLIWAIAASLTAIVLAGAALWFFQRNRQPMAAAEKSSIASTDPADSASPFPGMRESDVPGRYRWFHAGIDGGTVQLNPDHTFVNKEGKTLPKYRWELGKDGLRIIWQSGQIGRFPIMERPGVFVYLRPNGEDSRLEKIEGSAK